MKNSADENIAQKKNIAVTDKNLHQRDISIWIDSYDDVFSDFDPRPLSDRNVSDDFLYELKKISRESSYHINELKLLIPEKIRNQEIESIIIKRLHAYFKKNHQIFLEQQKNQNKKGFMFTVSGAIMMIAASYVSSIKSNNFWLHALFVILEPAGWFLVWAGLDSLIYSSREQKRELDFYNKMSKSKIVFVSI
jgi:hypothetical protein